MAAIDLIQKIEEATPAAEVEASTAVSPEAQPDGAAESLAKEQSAAADAPTTTTAQDLVNQALADIQAKKDGDTRPAPIQQSTTQLSTSELEGRTQARHADAIRNVGEWIDKKVEPYNRKQAWRNARWEIASQAIANLSDLSQGLINLAGTVGGAPNMQITSQTAAKRAADEVRQKRADALKAARDKQRQAEMAMQMKIAELQAKERQQAVEAGQKAQEAAAQKSYRDALLKLQQDKLDEQKRHNKANEANAGQRTKAYINYYGDGGRGGTYGKGKNSLTLTNPATGMEEVHYYPDVQAGALTALYNEVFEQQRRMPEGLTTLQKREWEKETTELRKKHATAKGKLDFISANLYTMPGLYERTLKLLHGEKGKPAPTPTPEVSYPSHTSPIQTQVIPMSEADYEALFGN